MESRLLVDLFIMQLINKDEIIQFFNSKLKTDVIDNLEIYDIIYSNNLNNKDFIDILSKACNLEINKEELEYKYRFILNFIYLKSDFINVELTLYILYSKYKTFLLDIDYDFWNSLATDYELKIDGFDGLTKFDRDIVLF